MATITSTIKLVDQMTPTLNKISKAIDGISKKSANMARSMETATKRANAVSAKSTADKVASNIAQLTREDQYNRKIFQAMLNRERLLEQEAERVRRSEEQKAKQAAQEKARAEKQAQAEIIADRRLKAQMEKRFAQEEARLARETARAEKQAAREALAAERQADREALASARQKAQLERQIAQQNAKYGNAMLKYTGLVNYKQNQFNSILSKTRSGTNQVLSVFRRILATLGMIVGVRSFVEVADTVMNANARITNITNDLAKTKYYMDAIYLSAQRSRSSFMDTANSVGKLATLAGSAFDGSMEQVIAFTELMNKLFVISGSSAAEASNAMYQLTQAMAAGKLQGDEMRSILENAPLLAQKLAEKLGVSVGEIKDLGAEGKITAEIIKDALFGSAKEIEEKFENMPKTIGQTWTEISNYALNAFRPVIDRVQQFINSPIFEKFKNKLFAIITAVANGIIRLFDLFETPRIQNAIAKICNAFSVLWGIVSWVGNAMVQIAIWISENWGWIAPIIYTIAWAFLVYKAAIAIATVAMWAYNAAQFVAGIIAGTVVFTTFGWVVLIIVAIIAVIYLAVAAWNHFTGQTVSATGIIFGSVAFVIACIWDLLVALWDVCGTIVDSIVFVGKILWQVFVDICETLANLLVNAMIFVINLIAAICTGISEVGTRLWDTLVWIGQVVVALGANVFAWIGNIIAALGLSIAQVAINIWDTFVWLGTVISTWGSNIATGMSQLCQQLPNYWEYFKASVVAKFWGMVVGGGQAFNALLKGASDIARKMVSPFENFANAVVELLNGLIRKWNSWCEKLTITIPGLSIMGYEVWGEKKLSVLGGGVSEIGKVSWTNWGDPSGVNLGGASANLSEALATLNSIKLDSIDWNSTPIPSYSDSVNWGSVTDAWNKGMDSFEYTDIPSYDVDWTGTWTAIKDAFNSIDFLDMAGIWDGSDYKGIWDDFKADLDQTWNSNDYTNPIEAFKEWYDKGDALENGITGLIDGIGALLSGLFGGSGNDDGSTKKPLGELNRGEGTGKDLPSSLEDLLGGYGGGGGGLGDALGSIADNTGSSAGSAGNIEDTLNMAEEELELLRKIAEQEVINRFTTAEIKVDMTNNNNISSKMDLDGIVTHLSNKLYEELGVVASGVHY